MEPLSALAGLKAVQTVSKLLTRSSEPQKAEKPSEFESLLRSVLQPDKENMINEEELFASLLQERIQKLKGAEAAGKFQELIGKYKDEFRRPDGITSVEKAANAAMEALVESGALTNEEADSISLQAFDAAQLDENHGALYDGRGSAGDPTIAIQKMEAALLSAKSMIEKFESGGATPTGPAVVDSTTTGGSTTGSLSGASLESAPANNPNDGDEGFLFKPESDSDGKLVVLLPSNMTGLIESLALVDEEGNELETGRFGSVGNGDREHFRFNRPGEAYPGNLRVVAKMKDGSLVVYNIDDPAQRYD